MTNSHYNEAYFAWQNSQGRFGGSINAEKFQPYIKSTDSILDFGCGGGWLLSSLTAAQKFGIEVNPSAAALCEQLGIKTAKSIDETTDGTFDVIISNHALEHTEAPLDVLRTAYRKLKPGGTAVFVVPCERHDTAYHPDNIDQHLYTWSPVNIGNLFRRAGFKVVSAERYAHRWPPKIELIDKLFGRSVSNLACRLYAHLRAGLTQVRVVATKS